MEDDTPKPGSDLMGFARVSNAGGALKLSLSEAALVGADRFEGKDGPGIALIINKEKLAALIAGEHSKDFVPVVQLTQAS